MSLLMMCHSQKLSVSRNNLCFDLNGNESLVYRSISDCFFRYITDRLILNWLLRTVFQMIQKNDMEQNKMSNH